MAKRKRRSKSKSKKSNSSIGKIIIIVVLLVLIGVGVYFTYDNYQEVNERNTKLDEVIATLEESFDKVISTDISLDTLLDDGATKVSWVSSDSKYLSNEGKVTRPSYTEGDKIVTLTATYQLDFSSKVSEIIYNFVQSEPKTSTFRIKILANEATDSEKVAIAIGSLYVPEKVYYETTLPTTYPFFESVGISWSGEGITSNTLTPATADQSTKLTATVSSGSVSEEVSFDTILTDEELIIDEASVSFNDSSLTSHYGTFTVQGFEIVNARVMGEESSADSLDDYAERYIRLRTNSDGSSYFISPLVSGVKSFSFDYQFSGTQNGTGSSLVVSTSTDNKTWTEVQTQSISNKDQATLVIDNLNTDGEFYIKVEHKTTYTESFINIDNIVITRGAIETDFTEGVLKKIPTSSNKYFHLPTTTSYGGTVTYTSSNTEVVTNEGVVKNIPDDGATVTMTSTITVESDTFTTTFDLKVTGTVSLTPVEIYFIDIGQYGTADCGESIYIKFGSVDILVDAGDNFASTKQAVEEAINAHLDDGILDYVIATHPDADHIGGMPNVFEKYQIENLIVFEGTHTSQKYRNFVTAYENEGCNVLKIYSDIIAKNNDTLTFDENFYLQFLDTKYYNVTEETNGQSIVFTLNAYDTTVLFTGDADNQGDHKELEANYMNSIAGQVDILKVVHHGTKEGTSLDFLRTIQPKMAIICNGNYLGNKHSHPHVDTITNLYAYDADMPVYCITGGGLDCEITSNGGYKGTSANSDVDRNGTITLLIDNNGYSISSQLNGEDIIPVNQTTFWKNYLAVK